MSEVFDAYCEDIQVIANDISRNLSKMKGGDSSETCLKAIQALLEQSADMVKQAEVEARSCQSTERKYLNEKLKGYKENLASLKSDYDNQTFVNQKCLLTGQKGEDRGRMLDVNEKIRRQNEVIENAKRSVAETEDIGLETLGELERNKEKIQGTRDKVRYQRPRQPHMRGCRNRCRS